jgi:hypothetical protein
MDSECDQVTSDNGLGREGCKYAALWSNWCSVTGAGNRQASSDKGCMVAHDGMAGTVIDDGLDRTRKGMTLVTAGAAATFSGKFATLDQASGPVAAAILNPASSGGGTVACGSRLVTATASHWEWTSLKEGSPRRGMVELSASGLDAIANARDVEGAFSM